MPAACPLIREPGDARDLDRVGVSGRSARVSPVSCAGGPLALVRNDDIVRLDAETGVLEPEVDAVERAARQAAWIAPEPSHDRGRCGLPVDTATQADEGADFTCLRGERGSLVTRESH